MFSGLSLGALNHLLEQAEWARAKLAPFAGKQARLSMPPWQLDFAICPDGYVEAAGSAAADVIMTLPVDAPLRALHGQDKVIEAARVEGNAQFATELSFVLRNLRWDAEEDLSHLVGDIAAHRIAQGVTALAGWQRDAGRRLAENVTEYLAEENPMLMRAPDIAAFGADLALLSEGIAQLEKRIDQLGRFG